MKGKLCTSFCPLHLPIMAGLVMLLCPFSMRAQTQEDSSSSEASCFSSTIVSVPSRPTVSNGADTTQCGVAEVEFGFERQWPGAGAHRDDLSGGLRLGLTPKLDFHWASGDYWNIVDATGARIGFGDTWLGLKYHFLTQGKRRPGLGIFYQAKVPSADETQGFGSGEVDHAISFLVSKDISRFHFDFNVTPLLAGRHGTPGVDHNTGFALSFSVPITRHLGLVGEGYGYSFLNAQNPAFASTMAGITYQFGPRLVLDAGLDIGVTPDAPPTRVYAGVTYALGNIYSWLRPER